MAITLFTIGSTKKSAEVFFERLKAHGVKRLIDVRLNNTSQLNGFTKRDDLAYLCKAVGKVDYVHRLDLAPTPHLLNGYKKGSLDWNEYERGFLQLIREREIETTFSRDLANGACLLCSEERPERCHRRLVTDYLKEKWKTLKVEHLL